jgi:hypothetical protein
MNENELSLKAATTTTITSMPADSIRKVDMSTDVEAKGEDVAVVPEWKPTKNEWLIMISLAFISLMVALDASILVTVLPVSRPHTYHLMPSY